MLLRPATARASLRVFANCRARRLYAASAVQEEAPEAKAESSLVQEESSQSSQSEPITKKKPRKSRKPKVEKNAEAASLWTRNLLEGTKVEEYLSALSGQPGLRIEDIERHRPQGHSSPETPQYEDEYTKLVASICQSFSAQQLRQLCLLYNLDPKHTRRNLVKPNYAISIIEEQWKWPSLADVRKHRALWSTYSARSKLLSLHHVLAADTGPRVLRICCGGVSYLGIWYVIMHWLRVHTCSFLSRG